METRWKLIAEARGFGIPEPELDRIAGTLEALEASFRPLAKNIPASIEPAVIFSCPREENRS